ncbi:hypothetical protein [Natronorarus salvus]|uniref:hypothetical protein n=1 Tax=Natronorarus salvus TaxID=3117733 RepID=UPI002F26B6C2
MTDETDAAVSEAQANPNPITEWLIGLIDSRIESALDDHDGDGMTREEVRELLVEEVVVTYGGDVGLRPFEGDSDGDGED